MRIRLALVLLLSAAAASAADYPTAFIDRPLVLPPGMVQLHAAYEPQIVSADGNTSVAAHFAFAGVDAGVARGLQLGAAVAFELSPDGRFDHSAVRAQYALTDLAAVRLDAGVFHYVATGNFPNGSGGFVDTQGAYGFLGGVGLAIKVPLGHCFAFTSGRFTALPPIGGALALASADDLVTVNLNGSNDTGSIGAPVGLLYQAVPALALQARAGVRHFFNLNAPSGLQNAVPLGLDVLLSAGALDLVVSGEMPGVLDLYTDVYMVRALAQGRF
jgi:hypothetical protein